MLHIRKSLKARHIVSSFNQVCIYYLVVSLPRILALMQAMQAAQGIVTAAKDGLQFTVAYSPQTQCTIISFAIISLIKVSRCQVRFVRPFLTQSNAQMSPLMRDDLIISDRLIQLAVSGITFLESVALQPTHLPARCASMLRGLLRKSSHQLEVSTAFRPGMEDHTLPMRSSRAVTPTRELPLGFFNVEEQTIKGKGLLHEAMATEENLSNTTPTSFTLFGMDGSTGLGQMTADEILDESFWLCIPPHSPITPWM
jgi:hypothetical protein